MIICIRDIIPSCILAPPEQEMMIRGNFSSTALSAALATFSPTTEPMLPPMKANSMAWIMTGSPPRVPRAVTMASGSPVFFWLSFNLTSYFCWSWKPRKSTG